MFREYDKWLVREGGGVSSRSLTRIHAVNTYMYWLGRGVEDILGRGQFHIFLGEITCDRHSSLTRAGVYSEILKS